MAIPLTRLKTPKAVPRRSADPVAATIAARRPCVMPMWMPHKAKPTSSPGQPIAGAGRASEANSTANPQPSKVEWCFCWFRIGRGPRLTDRGSRGRNPHRIVAPGPRRTVISFRRNLLHMLRLQQPVSDLKLICTYGAVKGMSWSRRSSKCASTSLGSI